MDTPPRDPARVRPCACAGRFYPRSAAVLRAQIEEFLAGAARPEGPAPKALIVPHAGYLYSGPVAASAYVWLGPARTRIRRVVLLGPAHYVPVFGVAAAAAAAFETPLGVVPVDRDAVAACARWPGVEVADGPHEPEHCLEVQLPFLQCVLEQFSIVPLLVGDADEAEVGRVLDAVWGGAETCVVVSSDLSHYLSHGDACVRDEATARAIAALRPNRVGEEDACGRRPIRGLLAAARRRGLECRRLDVRNSGDTAGPRDRVVGYGAFVFLEQTANERGG